MIYINRDEYEDDHEKKEKKDRVERRQKENLPMFNLTNYEYMVKEYESYSIQKKIDLQFAKRSVFSLELKEIEKIHKLRKIDDLEKKVLKYQQNWLQNKVWLCESEINNLFNDLPEDQYKAKIFKKIKDENIIDWSSGVPSIKIKMTYEEFCELSPQDEIKITIMYSNLFYLEFQALEKRKNESLKLQKSDEYEQLYLKLESRCNKNTKEWYTEEKGVVDLKEISRLYREELPDDYLFLEYRIDCMKKLIYYNDLKMGQIYGKELPKNYPYRKEILEEMQKAEVLVVKVLNLESQYWPVRYLQKEKIDARNEKYIPPFCRGKSPHVFNFEILNQDFDTYSPIKKIDVGLANHYVLILQINAIQKWRVSRKMNEYEEVISEIRYNELQYELSMWDMKIRTTYYNEKTFSEIYGNKLLDAENYEKKLSELWDDNKYTDNKYYQRLLYEVPYSEETLNQIHKKIETANIDERLWKSDSISETSLTTKEPQSTAVMKFSKLFDLPESSKNLILKFDELSPQNKIKYLIVKRNLLSVECDTILENRGKLEEYEKIVFDSKCACLSLRVMEIDDKIHHIFHSDLPKEYRKEILEEMKSASVSDNVFHAKTNFEETPGYM